MSISRNSFWDRAEAGREIVWSLDEQINLDGISQDSNSA
jgi:hypothetical protein